MQVVLGGVSWVWACDLRFALVIFAHLKIAVDKYFSTKLTPNSKIAKNSAAARYYTSIDNQTARFPGICNAMHKLGGVNTGRLACARFVFPSRAIDYIDSFSNSRVGLHAALGPP